jgi:hypothetical protein
VIAGRYGTLSTEGISYTERELDYAVSRDIPVLAFLHEQPEELAVKKTDHPAIHNASSAGEAIGASFRLSSPCSRALQAG